MIDFENIDNTFKEKFSGFNVEKGVLYVVSTPIGNLEDISLRALYILKNVDLIACEDTRVTAVLLRKYNIQNKMISYYAQVESKKLDLLINELKSGKSIALVSDSGTPAISDPGSIVISHCVSNDIQVIPVPGANALIHSLVMSGFNNKKFFFQGFLPLKGRENVLLKLKEIKMALVICESKFRIKKTITELNKYFPAKNISVSREMTKMHETTYRNRVDAMNKEISKIKEKGEFVIVIDNTI